MKTHKKAQLGLAAGLACQRAPAWDFSGVSTLENQSVRFFFLNMKKQTNKTSFILCLVSS